MKVPAFTLDSLAFPIAVTQTRKSRGRQSARFTVTYGKQVMHNLNYVSAAQALGYSIFHALACDARIDNGGDV